MSNILTNNINPRSGNLITIGGSNDRVSIAGTLTYEDVANIDSVGIITARQGLDTPTNLVLRTGGTEALRIDSSGRVAIGTDNPGPTAGEQLTIADPANAGITIRSGTNAAGSILFEDDTSDRAEIQYSHNGDYMRLKTNGLERMRVDSDGRLLLALTSSIGSNALFQIEGSGNRKAQFHQPDTGSCFVQFTNTTTGSGTGDGVLIGLEGDESLLIAQKENNDIQFHTNNTERMRIDSSGNVVIGSGIELSADTTVYAGAFSAGNGSATIFGNGSATFAGNVVSGSNGSAGVNNPGVLLQSSTGAIFSYITDNSRSFLTGYFGTSIKAEITSQGSATFAGTVTAQSYVTSSDQRFKENITNANSQLADVTALGNSLRNWDWTDDAPVADKDTRFLGLVAQEAETISPGIVTTIARTKDGDELTPEVVVPAVYETRTVPAVLDEEGEVIEPETTEEVLVTEEQVTPATYEQLDDSYKGIKNDVLVMKLLGAVAELSAKVAALEGA